MSHVFDGYARGASDLKTNQNGSSRRYSGAGEAPSPASSGSSGRGAFIHPARHQSTSAWSARTAAKRPKRRRSKKQKLTSIAPPAYGVFP